MANYYYQFDLTQNSFENTTITGRSSYDISEFNGDSRGTARVARWSDISSFSVSDLNAMITSLSADHNYIIHTYQQLSGSSSYGNNIGWISFSGSFHKFQNSSYRHYYASTSDIGGWHNSLTLSSSPKKELNLGSWHGSQRALVYFPNYEANGGHSALIINNSISVTWSSSNSRFQSSDSSTTLSHNGTTWVINNNGTSSTASLNSSNVGSYVDPASSDIVWQNNSSVTTPSAGAQGDPHINPILGNPYTI